MTPVCLRSLSDVDRDFLLAADFNRQLEFLVVDGEFGGWHRAT